MVKTLKQKTQDCMFFQLRGRMPWNVVCKKPATRLVGIQFVERQGGKLPPDTLNNIFLMDGNVETWPTRFDKSGLPFHHLFHQPRPVGVSNDTTFLGHYMIYMHPVILPQVLELVTFQWFQRHLFQVEIHLQMVDILNSFAGLYLKCPCRV